MQVLKVNILVSENALFSTVFGPFDMFIQAGVFWNKIHDLPLTPNFDVSITGLTDKEITGLSGAKIRPHKRISDDDDFDLVIVPSEGMNIQPHSQSFKRRVAYIKLMHERGAIVASICTGAFLLAATGLLNGKTATTHWALESPFRAAFPEVKLDTNLLIAEEGNVLTAGGVSADQDLCMRLIERCCDRDVALQTAKCTLVDFHNNKQSSFKSFVINKTHGDSAVLLCQKHIADNLHRTISISELAIFSNLTTKTLNRKFKKATNYAVNEYIQHLKVEEARRILEAETVSFEYVSQLLGYENVSFFRRLFKRLVGVSPKEYRRLFNGVESNSLPLAQKN
ncbi:GlxA family transcriptional regulator [Planctobacterium marinum]|uniref:HTH araC/xylS-type domain-containing protein n=1 Tax=Planctobacterium marinum TaxID=1631968 RepID=A0AA48KQW8_9ALTE|nr:hypothetical protein MACH26_10130 [Planctobacterium marinum]